MNNIYDANSHFPYDDMVFISPTPLPGGNHLIRCFANKEQTPIYFQCPKCTSKSGITQVGKRMHCELIFSQTDEKFIEWIQNIESKCIESVYNFRDKWFESQLERDDIENSFAQCLKLYKTNKLYSMRVNIPMRMGACSLKIYNENEVDVGIDEIKCDTQIITILELQGIKCSSKSFHLEFEAKQIMILDKVDIFEKFVFKKNIAESNIDKGKQTLKLNYADISKNYNIENDNITYNKDDYECISSKQSHDQNIESDVIIECIPEPLAKSPNEFVNTLSIESPNENEICEVNLSLDSVSSSGDTVQLKDRNKVYYELYQEAKHKAKLARDFAVAQYLEAKRIKNKHNLNLLEEDDLDDRFLETFS